VSEPVRVVVADDQALVRTGFRLILSADGIDVVAEATNGAEAVDAVRRTRPDVVLMDIRMPELDGLEATRRILADSAPGAAPGSRTVPGSGSTLGSGSAPGSGAESRSAAEPRTGAGAGAGAWTGGEAWTAAESRTGESRTGAGAWSGSDAWSGPRVLMLTTFDLDQYVYAALSAGASGFLLKDVTPAQLTAAVRLVRSGDALLAPQITRRLVERFARRDEGTATVHRDLATLTPREREVLRMLARGMSNAELAAELHLSEATVKTHVARILGKLQLRDRVQAVVVAYETGLVAPGEA